MSNKHLKFKKMKIRKWNHACRKSNMTANILASDSANISSTRTDVWHNPLKPGQMIGKEMCTDYQMVLVCYLTQYQMPFASVRKPRDHDKQIDLEAIDLKERSKSKKNKNLNTHKKLI